MFDKIKLIKTHTGNLSVWLYWNYVENNKHAIWNIINKTSLYQFLIFTSLTGGYSYRDDGVVMFEVPDCLEVWLVQNLRRFSKNVIINV